MNSISKLAGVFAALAVTAFAQTEQVAATESESSGLIGKKYVAAGFNFIDVNASKTDAFSTGAFVNVPFNSVVDITSSFSHSWLEANSGANAQNFNVGAVSYLTEGAAKPFVSVGLGYTWTSDNSEGLRYNVGAGVEYQLTKQLSLTLSSTFADGFRRRTQTNEEFSGTVGANYWVTKEIVVGASLSWLEHGHVAYGLAAGYRF